MDKYDKAIAYLSQFDDERFPSRVQLAWSAPWRHDIGGQLFQFCGPDGECKYQREKPYTSCGCLTQVHACGYKAWTHELTEAIRTDERLPKSVREITKEHLPVFAEWQRRLDREIRNVKEPT